MRDLPVLNIVHTVSRSPNCAVCYLASFVSLPIFNASPCNFCFQHAVHRTVNRATVLHLRPIWNIRIARVIMPVNILSSPVGMGYIIGPVCKYHQAHCQSARP